MKITAPSWLPAALLGVAAALAVRQALRLYRDRSRHNDLDLEARLDHTIEDSFPASDPPPF